MRFKDDAGTVSYHMPYVLPLKYLSKHLTYFSKDSQKLIGEYVLNVFGALRLYNESYLNHRFKLMNQVKAEYKSARALTDLQLSPIEISSTYHSL